MAAAYVGEAIDLQWYGYPGMVMWMGMADFGLKAIPRLGHYVMENKVKPLNDIREEINAINGGEEVVWDST